MTPWPGHRGATVAFATKHGKEVLVRPLLEAEGLTLVHVARDTDVLGTFSGSVRRDRSALEAARVKASWALEACQTARFALASEGSFGPHPSLPWAACGSELVLLVDRLTSLELVGLDLTTDTNFASRTVSTLEEAHAFAEQAGFPSHGLLADGVPLDRLELSGTVTLSTDMRAHRNPTRQASIVRATERCLRQLVTCCTRCGWPGDPLDEPAPGLPCADCKMPTRAPLGVTRRCRHCGLMAWHPALERVAAPALCDFCNP